MNSKICFPLASIFIISLILAASLTSVEASTNLKNSAETQVVLPAPEKNFPSNINPSPLIGTVIASVSGNAIVDNTPLNLSITLDFPSRWVNATAVNPSDLDILVFVLNVAQKNAGAFLVGEQLIPLGEAVLLPGQTIGNDFSYVASAIVNFTTPTTTVGGSFNLVSASTLNVTLPQAQFFSRNFSTGLSIGSSENNQEQQQIISEVQTGNSLQSTVVAEQSTVAFIQSSMLNEIRSGNAVSTTFDWAIALLELGFIGVVLFFELHTIRRENRDRATLAEILRAMNNRVSELERKEQERTDGIRK